MSKIDTDCEEYRTYCTELERIQAIVSLMIDTLKIEGQRSSVILRASIEQAFQYGIDVGAEEPEVAKLMRSSGSDIHLVELHDDKHRSEVLTSDRPN